MPSMSHSSLKWRIVSCPYLGKKTSDQPIKKTSNFLTKAREQAELNIQPTMPKKSNMIKKTTKIGRPGYKVIK